MKLPNAKHFLHPVVAMSAKTCKLCSITPSKLAIVIEGRGIRPGQQA
jgi:hypothetical protein